MTLPPAPPPAPPTVPMVEVGALPDGATVWRVAFSGPALSRVELSLRRDGPITGRVAAMAALWKEGTSAHPKGTWSEAVHALGAEIAAGCGPARCWIDVDAPTAVMPEALSLAAELLQAPVFPGVAALRRRWRAEWRSDEFAGDTVADLAIGRRTFGDGHPYRRDHDGTFFCDMAHARRAWRDLLASATVGVVVVGDADPAALGDADPAVLGAFPGHASPPAPPPPDLVPGMLLVDIPGEAVARVRLAWEGPPRDAADAGAYALALRIVGGDFTGRLNRRLRETLGYTYGIYARHVDAPGWGLSTVEAEVPADVLVPALGEIAAVLDDATFDLVDVDAARRAFLTEAAQETRAGIARPLTFEWIAGLRPGDTVRRVDALTHVSVAEVNEAAAHWLHGPRVWVVAGDAATLEPLLDASPLAPDAIWRACRAIGSC